MDRRSFLSQLLCYSLASGGASTLAGCGTLLHSERVGQPHSRDLDWEVVALNGLGLALFFVPGVVAFAVDFGTGAIFLPYESYEVYPQPETIGQSPAAPHTPHASTDQRNSISLRPAATGFSTDSLVQIHPPRDIDTGLCRIEIEAEEINQPAIEKAVSQQVGKSVALSESNAKVSRLADLRQFDESCQRHRRDPLFGISPRRFFERLAIG